LYVFDGATGTSIFKVTTGDGWCENGRAVAMSSDGTRIAVGILGDRKKSLPFGSVHVVDGTTGTTLFKVTAADEAPDTGFGSAVAISSDGARIAVGSPGRSNRFPGSVYVVDWASNTTNVFKETAADWTPGTYFGSAVAISSDGARIAVGAPGHSDASFNQGSLYVLDGTTGTTLFKVMAADGFHLGKRFGSAVAMSSDGTRIAVGAPGDSGPGSVYVVDGTTGTTLFKATAADEAQEGDKFGYAVAMSSDGNRIAVGAKCGSGKSQEGQDCVGSVYVVDGVNGKTLFKVTAADGAAYDYFGAAVAMSSDGARIAVGAPWDDGRPDDPARGSVTVFDV
jgi:outer membrane protein assembly factor BamB